MKTCKHLKYNTFGFQLLLLTLFITSCYNQQVVIDKIPLNTPEGSDIFITGDFNNWDPGDQRYRMTRNPDGTYSVDLPRGIGNLEYKFTRGDWTTVEKNECGYEIDNRSLDYGDEELVVNQISCWGDTQPMNCPRTVFVIKDYPSDTPEEALIYIASPFNGWNPGDLGSVMKKHPGGFYYYNLEKRGDCMEFKFTLGNWESVETSGSKADIDNRVFCFDGKDTVYFQVKNWKSLKYRRSGKVTFILNELPVSSRPGEQIYLAGDFNSWNPGDPAYTFKTDSAGRLAVSVITDKETVSFKLTRGNWNSVEVGSSGSDIPNRVHVIGQNDTVYLQPVRWKDR